MSRENVEAVLTAYAAWGAGEWEAQRASLDSDVFMRMAEGWPEPGPFSDAVERQLRQMRDTVEDGSAEPIGDPIDIADRVVARVAWRGAGSGPRMDMEATAVYSVRRKKICSIEFFWDHGEALEAVGLRE